MFRLLAVAMTGTLALGVAEAVANATGCRPQAVNVRHANSAAVLKSGAAGDSLCVRGEPTAIKLELHATTISAALAELLAAYNVSYRSSIALDETRNGTYKGSLRQVIFRLLDGYDFIIAPDGDNLLVVIVARNGERAIAAPVTIQMSERDERPVHASRDH